MPLVTSFSNEPKYQLKNIAVFRALKLGDMLNSIPAIRAIKQNLPQSKLYLISLPWVRELAKRYAKYIDEFVEFPGYPGLPEQEYSLEKWLLFMNYLSFHNFDLVIQMHGNGRITNNMIFENILAKNYAGYSDFVDKSLGKSFFPYPENQNEILKWLELVNKLGFKGNDHELEFPLNNNDYRQWRRISKKYKLIPKRYICLHPGSESAPRWNPKYFAWIGSVISMYGFNVVITGSEKESGLANQVSTMMNCPSINLAGKTSLGALASVLSHSKLLISNNTGVSHLATALKVPSVVIFLSSNLQQWAPLNNELHHVVSPDMANDPWKFIPILKNFWERKILESN